jgi:hypothetical protein
VLCRAVRWWVGISEDGDPVAGNGDPRLGHGQNKTQPQSAKTKPKLQIKDTQQNQQRTFLLPPRRLAAQPRQPAWVRLNDQPLPFFLLPSFFFFFGFSSSSLSLPLICFSSSSGGICCLGYNHVKSSLFCK